MVLRIRLLGVLALFAVLLAAGIGIAGLALPRGWVTGPVEMASAGQFHGKLGELRRAPGRRIVVLGDSLVFGQSLEADHSGDWRAHTLGRHLAACLSGDVSVLNFGQNGLLPRDIAAMLPHLLEAGAETVVFNVNSRSVSADFDAAAEQLSRPWLDPLAAPPRIGVLARLDLARQRVFDGTALEFFGRKMDVLFAALGLPGRAQTEDTVVLLKLKQRYATARFDPETSIQTAALEILLTTPGVVAFDTLENPELLSRVARRSVWERLHEEKTELVARTDAETRFIPAPESLVAGDFLDFMHVSSEGYAKYAAGICARLNGTNGSAT